MHDSNFINGITQALINSGKTQEEIALLIQDYDKFGKILKDICNTLILEVKQELENNKNDYLQSEAETTQGFQERLYKIWSKPLERLETLVAICTEIGTKYFTLQTTKSETLCKLHARVILIAREIVHLLIAGYPDGAMARWRSLHETAIIIEVLAKNTDDIIQRYLDYEGVENYKSAKQYNKYCKQLEQEEVDIDNYEIVYNNLKKKYSNDFVNEYGWSAILFPGKKKITLYELESVTGFDFLRPYFKFASNHIHSSPKSIGYKLGLSWIDEDIMLAGPSNMGLSLPISLTSGSLMNSTISCMSIFSLESFDLLLNTSLLYLWNQELRNELITAEGNLKKNSEHSLDD